MIEYKGVNYHKVTKIVYKYPDKINGVYALYGSFMHAVLENMVRKHFNMEERDFFVNHLDGLSCSEVSEQIQRDVQNFLLKSIIVTFPDFKSTIGSFAESGIKLSIF